MWLKIYYNRVLFVKKKIPFLIFMFILKPSNKGLNNQIITYETLHMNRHFQNN